MNKKEAWEYYKSWMKEKTYCKALKSEIRITRLGWDHINRGTKGRKRSAKDRNIRLSFLKQAKTIIKNSNNLQKRLLENGHIYYSLEEAVDKYKKIKIKVVIKEDKLKNKVLFSIMKSR